MATIALYAGKINQMPSLISDVRKSVDAYSSELFSMKSKALNIRRSVCDLDDVLGMVQASTQLQERKSESLDAFCRKTEEFAADVVRTDEDAAALINQSKEDFYNKYNYLKPDAEKSGWEEFWDDASEWCREHWESICNIVLVIVIAAVAVGIAAATWGWLIVGLVAAVGAVAGAGGQLISDLVSWAVTGKWESSVQDYIGAMAGGAIGGVLMLFPGQSLTLACFMDGMTSTLVAESLKNLTGCSNKTNEEIWGETLISAGISGLLGKGCEKLSEIVAKPLASAFPGLKRLSGRGSYAAAYKMVLTKLKNNTCKNISLKTLRNGFISGMWEGLFGIFFGELFKNSVDQIRAAA